MDKTPNPTSRLPLGVEKFPAYPCLWQRGGREGRGGENKTTDDGKKQIDNIYIKKKRGACLMLIHPAQSCRKPVVWFRIPASCFSGWRGVCVGWKEMLCITQQQPLRLPNERGWQALMGYPSSLPWLERWWSWHAALCHRRGLFPGFINSILEALCHCQLLLPNAGLSRTPSGAHPPVGEAVIEKHRIHSHRVHQAWTTLTEIPAPAGWETKHQSWEWSQE